MGLLGVIAKGFVALCMTLLVLVAIGLVVLLYQFASFIALAFFIGITSYIAIGECWDALVKRAKSKGS